MPSVDIVPCGKCGAPVTWARTESDRAMPLDVDSNPFGNVVILATQRGLRAHVLKAGDPAPSVEERRMPHFATCNGKPRRWPVLTVLSAERRD